ncbi:MAG: ParB/RepB/Spo0J family partition protein [Deltaproteobacteria bacterium]|nr:ParB/RepB/Spo0J family partition protein [Deltaproteobacteria bacterium]MBW2394522.1 ParB/RepB/Spo0J family partition protein [Deltaproteobacteria bacterium]
MAARRNALGRGLDALIPREPVRAPAKASAPTTTADEPRPVTPARVEPPSTGLAELSVDAIVANPEQPRRIFDDAELQRLADSIQRHGVLQPVVVRRAPDGAAAAYELIVGERRWRASRLAGRPTIPATIQDLASRDLLEVALIENVQRADLNPIELAMAFRALQEQGATQEEVGRRVGLDRSTVANHLRLLDLPRELQSDVENGILTTGHAKALLGVSNPERRHQLRDRIASEQLSVRAAEALARQISGPGRRLKAPARAGAVDPNLQSLIDALRERLQTQVRITGSGQRGRIEIDFFGPEDLHRLSQAILDGSRL